MEVFSWGANSHGQLGQGVLSEQCNTPQMVKQNWKIAIDEIFSGGGHSLFIDEEGQVYGCGWNEHKQLGYENKNTKELCLHTFTKIWELSGITFQTLSVGWDFSAGITNRNVLYLWGSNCYGQLGLPKEHFPKYVKPVQLELRVRATSMGMRHTALIDINGYVWTAGNGKCGQLGQGSQILSLDTFKKIGCIESIERVKCGQNHVIAWSRANNVIYGWGDNTFGQLGLGKDAKKSFLPQPIDILNKFISQVVDIYCGWTHSAALLADGRAVYWGRNNYGQLGCANSNTNINIVSVNGLLIKELGVGSEHSACIMDDGSVWSWGWNEHGNTGTGQSENVTEPTKINFSAKSNHKKKRLFVGTACNYLIDS